MCTYSCKCFVKSKCIDYVRPLCYTVCMTTSFLSYLGRFNTHTHTYMIHLFKPLAISIAVVASVAIAGTVLYAQETPPENVSKIEEILQDNQDWIRRNQATVDEFNRRKSQNSELVGALSVYGYSFDWANNRATKSFQ